MSNFADLYDKIRDRAASDTGSGGLFDTGGALITAFYYAALPPETAMPYCYFMVASDSANNTFTMNGSMVEFRIVTCVSRAFSTDPIARGSAILKRIYGNSASGSLTPTYGFHRYDIALTDWTATTIEYQRTIELHEETYYAWSQEFKLWLFK